MGVEAEEVEATVAYGDTECQACGFGPYDGTHYRWRCPSCGMKDNCCDGAPLHVKEEKNDEESDEDTACC